MIIPKYWRTKSGAEVDFVIESSSEIIPVEVKLAANTSKLDRGFRAFIEKYKPKRGVVVTYRDEKGRLKVNGCEIFFTDVFEFCKYIKDFQK